MPRRADAHIHLMSDANHGRSFARRPGVEIDEVSLYTHLARTHDIVAALIVGYQGADWCASNNAFLARIAPHHDWMRPVAYIEPQDIRMQTLQEFKLQKFYGISMYTSSEEKLAALGAIDDEIWAWLVEHHWLISINSRGSDWAAWQPILQRHGELRMLASHLGLPAQMKDAPTAGAARSAMADVTALARFPGVRVKLSGFYALSDPGHDYPHHAAWPYVQVLVESFGTDRLLWGSDCTPSLNCLTMPQTIDLLAKMPFLSDVDRTRIEGENLLALFDEVVRN